MRSEEVNRRNVRTQRTWFILICSEHQERLNINSITRTLQPLRIDAHEICDLAYGSSISLPGRDQQSLTVDGHHNSRSNS